MHKAQLPADSQDGLHRHEDVGCAAVVHLCPAQDQGRDGDGDGAADEVDPVPEDGEVAERAEARELPELDTDEAGGEDERDDCGGRGAGRTGAGRGGEEGMMFSSFMPCFVEAGGEDERDDRREGGRGGGGGQVEGL